MRSYFTCLLQLCWLSEERSFGSFLQMF